MVQDNSDYCIFDPTIVIIKAQVSLFFTNSPPPLFLIVDPPTVMLNIDQHDRNQIRFTKNVTFICNVTSNPNSTINWKKGSTDVTKCSKCEVTTERNYGVLSIYNLTRDDTANYTCLAKNTHGNDSDTKELIVLCKYENAH